MMMCHASLLMKFWDYGILTAAYLYKHNPSIVLDNKLPMELLIGRTLDYNKLRILGSKCFLCLNDYCRTKLDDKLIPRIFLGYPHLSDSYICFEPKDGRIFISRDVTFVERDFSLNDQLDEDQDFSSMASSSHQIIGAPPIVSPVSKSSLSSDQLTMTLDEVLPPDIDLVVLRGPVIEEFGASNSSSKLGMGSLDDFGNSVFGSP